MWDHSSNIQVFSSIGQQEGFIRRVTHLRCCKGRIQVSTSDGPYLTGELYSMPSERGTLEGGCGCLKVPIT